MTTLREAFEKKYPQTANKILLMFTEATGFPPTWDNITKPNVAALVDYMYTQLAGSSVRTYCAQLKAVINLYSEDVNFPHGLTKMLTVKNESSEQVYLTDKELQRIIRYKPDTKIEAIVQQQFILSALIGARHGDIVKLSEANIRDEYVCYVSEKTHIKAQVPLAEVARKILEGRFFHGKSNHESFAYKDIVSDVYFNDTLRRICMLCDIDEEMTLFRKGKTVTAPKWKFIASHTGRRTCATLLYLHDCDIYSISRILAHNSVEMTAKKYICSPLRNLSNETMKFFNQFK